MNNRNIIKTLVITTIFVFLGITHATAHEFSTDVIHKIGKEIFNAKIYVSDKKIRTEMNGSIIITRMDKNVTYVFLPEQKMYSEHPTDLKTVPKIPEKFDREIERQFLGKEMIDGKSVKKFKVTYEETYIHGPEKESVYQWLIDSKIPIKIEAVDGSWGMEYKNLKIGKQPADLFEPPAGYEKMSMPSMGDMMNPNFTK